MAAFCWLRSREITDNLVELLIQIVHRIGARVQRRVEKELLNDFKKVSGKTGLLFQLAEAALDIGQTRRCGKRSNLSHCGRTDLKESGAGV